MRTKFFILIVCCQFLAAIPSLFAASEAASPGLQASNLMNPNISVIGWLQGETGHHVLPAGQSQPESMQLKEMEVSFQAVVDPYSRADVFLSVEDGKISTEEGYVTWFTLPGNLSLKAGKFKANLGRFNRQHTPETAFADRPLVHEKYFGDGLSGVGGSLSWQVPIPNYFVNLDLEAFGTPSTDEVPSFGKAARKNITAVSRLSGYTDLTEATNLTAGVSYALGSAGQEFDSINNSSTTLQNKVLGLDWTFRYKNPHRAIYRSLIWQTEFFLDSHENSAVTTVYSRGLFSHIDYQFAQRWHCGLRYDYSESPTDKHDLDRGGLTYLTFYPSEFSLISVQGKHVLKADGEKENIGYLKMTFNIGPHGAHPF